ncbi:MAG TPA: PH domain-containing protein [Brevibacterium senegalense]|uniref:PH domain-containing protein n=1 Tax=Brevibacterium senegalense TaxID=1033736 RepID=A0A921MBK8_9MICO|nr:PH domain-containing protein [Brevibacterium senegalense]
MTPLNPVSPKYAGVRIVRSVLQWGAFVLVFAVLAIVGLVIDETVVVIISLAFIVPFLVGMIIEIIIVFRQVRALGYREREHDLLLQRGIMFRSTTVIPYGRLQYVEVTAGPIMRALGLATVTMHTASASTDASLPGLPRAEAEALRDSIAARGGARLAGL